MSSGSNLPLSGTRLWADLHDIARIGGTPRGGCDRQSLTDADAEGRAWLQERAEALGCHLVLDRFGNMGFLRPGRDASRRPVAFGSHLDTQPTGGKYDGVLGVLAGLEIMRALAEAGAETEAPLLLVNWTNEEGARFSPPMQGSGAAMGVFSPEQVLDTADAEGKRFGAELSRIGWRGRDTLPEMGAYLELHIEQGPELERGGHSVGVVTHALAQRWYEVEVTGESAHGGSRMEGRRDALMAAAPLMAAVEEIALSHGGRGTVGIVRAYPGSRNVAPERAWFSVDTRHGDEAALEAMGAALRARAAELAAARKVGVEVRDFWHSPGQGFDARLRGFVRDAAARRGIPARDMPTAIGHDAVYVARRVPTAMVFVPCHGGLSHNEAESMTPEWAEAGLLVLADAVLDAANSQEPF
ncbi:Zn-dependent hydrolase [Sabulicella glaciei]|uniref:Zn-dependent hydrolase n=1 Tax=Sabulicella glaciei TaxID=2984948 RepID=A0ABT3NYA4_9PROT|nr:Zn-dependent hydrolase [Roseococcus sp. MDT2-1-1]